MSIFGKKPTTTKPVVRTYHDKVCDNGYVTINGLTMAEANLHLSSSVSSDKLISALIYFFAEGSTINYEPSNRFVGENGTMQVVPACKLCGSGHPVQVIWTNAGSTDSAVYEYGNGDELTIVEWRLKGSLEGRAWVETQGDQTIVKAQIDYEKGDFQSWEISFGQKVDLGDIDKVKHLEAVIAKCKIEPGKMFEWARCIAKAIMEIIPIGNEFHAWYSDNLIRFSCTYKNGKLESCQYSDAIYSYSYSDGKKYSVTNPFASLMVEQRDKWTSRTFEHQDGYEYEEAKMQGAFNSLLEKYGKLNLA